MQYLYSTTIGIILGWLLYQVAILSSTIDKNNLVEIICPVLGGVGGILLVFYLYYNKKSIYKVLNKKFWILPFLHINLIFGVLAGLVFSSFIMWLLLGLFSWFFGHPESQEWSLLIGRMFFVISGTIAFGITIFITIYCVKSGTFYLEKQ